MGERPIDFFEHQDAARKSSRRLVGLFALAVGAIVLVVAALAGGSMFAVALWQNPGLTNQDLARLPLWETVAWAAGITLAMIVAGSSYKTAQLAGGGAAVARAVGATPLEPEADDRHARRLRNVVEEMALAAGCPVPAVFVMEDERAINAFAAGWSLDDAVIGVTRGAMTRLSRDELQGVVAHEFSHILHGDMRLNLRLTGLVFGILVLSVTGATVVRTVSRGAAHLRPHRRDRRNNGGGAAALIVAVFLAGALLYLVGLLGVFFARLIQAAVSRQREFLADAAAVQYTRNPEGIGGALMKIGGMSRGNRLGAPQASAFGHLFFARASGGGVRGAAVASLATHPPLADRIRRLLPAWDGRWSEQPLGEARSPAPNPNLRSEAALGLAPAAALAPDPDDLGSQPAAKGSVPSGDRPVGSRRALAFVGEPTADHLRRSRELIAGLPPLLAGAARTREGAPAVVFALLIDRRDGAVAAWQQAHLAQHLGVVTADLTAQLVRAMDGLDPAGRLPLLDLTLPALRARPAHERRAFEAHVDVLIDADDRLGLFEWALRQVLWRHLVGPGAARLRRTTRLRHREHDLKVLLEVMAWAGQDQRRYGAAAGRARQAPAGIARLTDAVDRLGTLNPADTRAVVEACAAAVAADGRVTVGEFELLRAVCETLDVPVPPLLPGQQGL